MFSERQIAAALEFSRSIDRTRLRELPPDLRDILLLVLLQCRKVRALVARYSEVEMADEVTETFGSPDETRLQKPGQKSKIFG